MPAEALDGDQVRAIRAAGQRLDTQRGPHSASNVVTQLVAVQAQDLAAAALGVAVRADNLTVAAVDYARNVEPSYACGACAGRCTSSPPRTCIGCWN